MAKRPRRFKTRTKRRDEATPPRLILLVDGECEDRGMPKAIRKAITHLLSEEQADLVEPVVLRRTSRLPNGVYVEPVTIRKKINALAAFHLDEADPDAEYVLAVSDHEARTISWEEYLEQLQIDDPRIGVAVASRDAEAWMLADVEACEGVQRARRKPRQRRHVESVPAPCYKEVKKYWPGYSKTTQGPRFLAALRPHEARTASRSYDAMLGALSKLLAE